MSDEAIFPLRYFEPHEDVLVVERKLPHWSQAGTLCFITFRTFDSMPKPVIQRWFAQRHDWLRRHGVDPTGEDWKGKLRALGPQLQAEFRRIFSERWHRHLDTCHGKCVLRRTELSRIVVDSLCHFDEDRYLLTDFVVMPNHVHVLAAFVDEEAMLAQCDSWKHFTARQINQRLGRKGRFWQVDGFDHLVRGEEQFQHLRKYIEDNPLRARLKEGEYVHYMRPM